MHRLSALDASFLHLESDEVLANVAWFSIFEGPGNLYIGVTGDYDTAPDIDVMCRGIDRGISDLIHADAAATRPGCTGSSGQRSVDPAGGAER